jgi:hypothetical protein
VKSNYPFLAIGLIVLLVRSLPAASAGAVAPAAEIVMRGPIAWDTIYGGTVDAQRSEQWTLTLTQDTFFFMGPMPTTLGVNPVMILVNPQGEEEIRTTNVLTTVRPAGTYIIKVQSQGGSGSYQILLQRDGYGSNIPPGPSTSTVVEQPHSSIGVSIKVTVNLNNIPPEGYSSAEFTCTYDAGVAAAGDIAATSLFGADPAVAISGPQNGKFIIAIAGSNGNKAFGIGPVIRDAAITFRLNGLRAGFTLVTCIARVSRGDNTLATIPFTPANIAFLPNGGSTPEPFTPTPGPTATAISSPTAPSPATGTVTGKILAGKPVRIDLFDLNNNVVTSKSANPDGSFSLTAPAGTYKIVAVAAGFLGVLGPVTIAGGANATLPTVSLAAGDIDNNNIIDQFDALTLGMNYNASNPAAADLNNDGTINILDLELLARNYRKTGPQAWQ